MLKNLIRGSARALFAILAALSASSTPLRAADALPAPPGAAASSAPLVVGFVYVSPIGEAGWTYQHELGRREMERALGARVKTVFVESVAEGADSERVMRDLVVSQGAKLVLATSFGYLEPALRVAAEFPDVRFEHAGGYKTSPNLGTYDARYYEARYLAGLLAGASSRSGIAGYVAGFPVPEVVQGINAFMLGMREVNPKAVVKVIWLDTWFDPAREAEAARTLINQGADVLTNHSASPAVAQAAQAAFRSRGVRFVGYQSDMHAYAPDAQLGAVTHHWGAFYTQVARAVLAGTWSPVPVWGGIAQGFVDLTALDPALPQAIRSRIEARRNAIVAGSFKPFSAPLTDNQGKLRLARGTLDDRSIAAMNWFVEGVVGTVPKKP